MMENRRLSSTYERILVIRRELVITLKALTSSKLAMAGLLIIIAVATVALLAPIIAIQHPYYVLINGSYQQRWSINTAQSLNPPSFAHPFGTDELGTDLFSKVVYAARVDLPLAFEVIIFSALLGIVVGGLAGYFEGRAGGVVMRITDIFLAVPSIILALALVASLGPSLSHIVIALIATWWAWYARLIFGETRRMKHKDFVEVARSAGFTGNHIFFRHVLSNVLSPVIIQATSDLGSVILTVAGLSFLGLGAPPGTAEWGTMLSQSQTYIFEAWWYALFPGFAIVATSLSFYLLGDGLRDVLDPTSRRVLFHSKKKRKQLKEEHPPVPHLDRDTVLKLNNVSVEYQTDAGKVRAVRDVSMEIKEGEGYGLIGESGSGKSTIASAIMGLLPQQTASVSTGEVLLNKNGGGQTTVLDLPRIPTAEMDLVRGKDIAIIFQEVSDSLHPAYRVGFQIGQTYLLHQFELILEIASNEIAGSFTARSCDTCGSSIEDGEWLCKKCQSIVRAPDGIRISPENPMTRSFGGSQKRQLLKYQEIYRRHAKKGLGPSRPPDKRVEAIATKLAARDLRKVMVPDPERTAQMYPFELSGGMKQRAMIAMMMACNPRLLIADEPTTALDVVTERSILDLLKKLKQDLNVSILLISHDLNVIRRFCDRVGVIYAGKLVEEGPLDEVFEHAKHPYTHGLIRSLPRVREGENFVKRGDLYTMEGSVPELKEVPAGCVFADRCERTTEDCRSSEPPLREIKGEHFAACIHPMLEEK